MKKVFFFSIAAGILSLTGCSSNDEPTISESEYITIDSTIGQMSRVTTSDNGSQTFSKDDKISVYAWTGDNAEPIASELVINNRINTFDGAVWTANPMMKWKDTTSKHFFLGVFPTRNISNFTVDSYTLDPENQLTSDLLVALNTSGLTASKTPVQLDFNHVMAKLVVNLSFNSQWGETPTITSVTAKAKKTATINYLTNDSTAVTATGTTADITLPSIKANTTYSSIMVPESNLRTIEIVINGNTYTYTNNDEISLISGKYTTIELMIGRDEDKIVLNNVTINDWVEGDTIEGEAL